MCNNCETIMTKKEIQDSKSIMKCNHIICDHCIANEFNSFDK